MGVFYRCNTSVATEELASKHCRDFYCHLHKKCTGPRLKEAVKKVENDAKNRPREASAAPSAATKEAGKRPKAARVKYVPPIHTHVAI